MAQAPKVTQLDPSVGQPLDQAVLAAIAAGLNPVIPPRGAYRSRADQQALWDDRANNPNPVARPGTSLHERGGAVDIHEANGRNAELDQILNQFGLYRPDPQGDPPHYQLGQASAAAGFDPQGGVPVLPPAPGTPDGPAGTSQPGPAPIPYSVGAPPAAAGAGPGSELDALLGSPGANPGAQAAGGAAGPGSELNALLGGVGAPAPTDTEHVGPSGWWQGYKDAVLNPSAGGLIGSAYNILGYPIGTAIQALGLGGLVRPLAGAYFGAANVVNRGLQGWAGNYRQLSPEEQAAQQGNPLEVAGRAFKEGYYSPGGTFFRPVQALTGVDNPVTQVADLVADWVAGGKLFDLAVSPIAHLATGLTGRAAGALGDVLQNAPGIGKTIQAYRAAAEVLPIVKEHYAPLVRGVNSVMARFNSVVQQVGEKSAEHPGIEGQFVDGVGLPGNLYDQAIGQYVDAGTAGSFFPQGRASVLNRAAELGLDPEFVRANGDRVAQIYQDVGALRAEHGQIAPEVFDLNKGFYAPRDYHVYNADPAVLEGLRGQLQGLGEEGAPALDIIDQQLNQAPRSGAFSQTGKVGVSLPHRLLETPEQRAALVPELGFIGPGNQNLAYQATQAFKGEALSAIANDARLSGDLHQEVAQGAIENLANRPEPPVQLPRNPDLVDEGKQDRAVAQERLSRATENQGIAQGQSNGAAARVVKAQSTLDAHLAKGEPLQPVPPPDPVLAGTPRQAIAAQFPALNQAVNDAKQALNRAQATAKSRPAAAHAQLMEQLTQQHLAAMTKLAEQQRLFEQTPEVTRKDVPSAYRDRPVAELYTQGLRDHAQALKRWQGDVERYHNQRQALETQLANRNAEYAAKQQVFGETVKERQAAEAMRDAADRKIARGRGVVPDETHAADAVADFEKRIGQKFTPQERQMLAERWLDGAQRGRDVFRTKLPPAEPIPGTTGEILNLFANENPIDAVTHDPVLAAQNPITPEEAVARDFVPWEGKQYGPMNGRYGSRIAKNFVDAAIKPDRFQLQGPGLPQLLESTSKNYRFLRAYANPTTHFNVMKGQFFQAVTGAAEHKLNLLQHLGDYFGGMKQLGELRQTGKITPLIEAMMERDSPLRPAIFTDADRALNSRIGLDQGLKAAIKKNVTNPIVQRFIDIHILPKIGLANVLAKHSQQLGVEIPAGMTAEAAQGLRLKAAAAEAERMMGGMEGGAVHYPGQDAVQGALEAMNRYGLAPFTAYPLHTMNRFLQLMHTNPRLLLRYPQLRSYLYAADQKYGNGQAGERFNERQVDYTDLPLPFGRRDGNAPFMAAGHLIPGEDAAEDWNLGGGLLQFPKGPLGVGRDAIAYGLGFDWRHMRKIEGANPDTLHAEAFHQALQSLLPSAVGSTAERLERSLKGMPPHEATGRPESPLMPLGALVGVDTHYPESRLERQTRGDVPVPKESRVNFLNSVNDEIDQHPERLRDYSPFLKGKDGVALQRLGTESQRELVRLLADGHMDEDAAKPQIRFQAHFLRNIYNRLQSGPHLFGADQAQSQRG